jgi:flagellar motor protein MotB
VSRIEGHGAAALILSSDPYAAANRRVEFLLQAPEIEP